MVQSRILVIDDDEDVHELFKAVLSPEQEVLTAGDWAQATPLLFGGTPLDLVILDVGLPVVGGTTIAAALRNARFVTRIVLHSAMDEGELRRVAAAVGAAGYIPKPCDASRLSARVKRFLGT